MPCLQIPNGCVCEIEYVARALEAERRIRRGERQVYCGMCVRWRWPEECSHSGRLSAREFAAMVRQSQREVGREYGHYSGRRKR